MTSEVKKTGWKELLLIHAAVIVYSFCGVFQKLAGGYPTLSLMFLVFYGCSVLILVVYAFLWQIILARVSLSTAYSNRAVAMIWSVVWGILFFQEEIRWNHAVGALIICFGVFLVTTGGVKSDD